MKDVKAGMSKILRAEGVNVVSNNNWFGKMVKYEYQRARIFVVKLRLTSVSLCVTGVYEPCGDKWKGEEEFWIGLEGLIY